MEIVTWVLDGELEHKDSERQPGHHLSGPGPAHERRHGHLALGDEPAAATATSTSCRCGSLPDTERIEPGYEQLDINAELGKGGLVPIASGRGHAAAISIRQKGAVLWGGRLKPGETVRVPDAPFVHLFVARGGLALEGAGISRHGRRSAAHEGGRAHTHRRFRPGSRGAHLADHGGAGGRRTRHRAVTAAIDSWS